MREAETVRGVMVLGALLAGLALTGGCAGDGGMDGTLATDSAGVRIVVSRAPAWGPSTQWEVVGAPVLDLTVGGEGPDYEFYRVTDAVRLSDGRVVVANDGSSEVRFYSADGRLEARAGGNGDGPGEFRRIRTVSRMRGDSVAVYDALAHRLTILDSRGGLGRVVTFRNAFRRARHLRVYADSMFLGLVYTYEGLPALGRYRIPYAVVQLGPDGAVMDTLTTIGGGEGFRTATVDSPLPYPKEGHLATRGREIVVGDADSLAFERFSGPHAHSQSVRVSGYPLALTSEEVDSTMEALLHRSDGRPHPPNVTEALESLPVPTHRPGYSRLLMDELGYVWAARYYRGMHAGRTVEWEIFSPSGVWLGRMATPRGFTVHRIGEGEILGVQRDELGVEHVQVLSLVRP